MEKSNLLPKKKSLSLYSNDVLDVEKQVVVESLDRSSIVHKTTNLQTIAHLMKSMIGTGILAMPNAFFSSGIWLGLGLTLSLGLICLHCMNMLVRLSQTLCMRTKQISLDYGEVLEISLLMGPTKLIRYSRIAKWVVNTFLSVMQFGECSVYIVFVATNIKQVVEEYDHFHAIDARLYMLAVASVLFLMIFIKHLKFLAIFSLTANILLAIGLIIILQHIVQDLPDISTRIAVNSAQYIPLYFGTALFSFEGIGIVLPLENKMATPSDMGGYCGVLTLTIVISTCCYATLGFYGYLKFGSSVAGSITLNLPQSNWLYSVARLVVSISVLLTYLIQFYVPMSILLPHFDQKINARYKSLVNALVRTGSLALTLILALVIPHLDLLIAFIGSLAATCLTLIFPPMIDLIVQTKENTVTYMKIVKNVFILIFGVIISISGVAVSLTQVIHRYQTL